MKLQTLIFTVAISAILGMNGCAPKQGTNTPTQKNIKTERFKSTDANLQKLTDIAFEKSYGYEITRSLTTEIGSRLAGSKNEARARDWAMDKFKELGFKDVQINLFHVDGWARGREQAFIVIPHLEKGDYEPQKLFVTALGGSVATPEGGITADLAFFENFEALKNAAKGGLDGKIVYITGKMEKTRDGAGYGPANQKRRNGATEAAKRGAIAVLIRSVGTDSHRFPHTGQMGYEDGVKKIPIGALSAPDADQIDRMFANANAEAESGKTVRVHLELATKNLGRLPSGNVYADIIGSTHPEEIVMIGAHLDSWDLGTGAIDDGAGVGIVMGAAKVLMESGFKPERTVRVILFGSEEIGLKGGFAYAKQHKDELGAIVVATESDFGAAQIYGLQAGKGATNKASTDRLYSKLKYLGLEMVAGKADGGPDIIPLNRKGVPVIDLKQNGYDYFDLHHTPDDTFDKIDPKEMAQNVAVYANFIYLASKANVDFSDNKNGE
ncbi:MAG: M20/M25/M40 family metallo-hydrolase [Robiginitomaculum sp.]